MFYYSICFSGIFSVDSLALCFFKISFQFVAVTSFQLLVFVFFVAVGLDKIRKPLLFSVAAGLYFFSCCFSFHTAGCSAFVFQLRFSVDRLALCFFINQFLKSCLALQFLLFMAAVLADKVSLFVRNIFLRQRTVTSFCCKQFYIFKQHSFFNSLLSKFYLLLL